MSVDILLILLAVGAGGGFLSGLLGVGGGIIFVPALYFFLSSFGGGTPHAMHLSIGTSMALVLVTGATSTYWQHKKGAVDFSLLKSWGPFMVLGVAGGSVLAASVPGDFLKQLFACLTLLLAPYIAFAKDPAEGAAPAVHRLSKAVQRILAAGIGLTAALVGIGGAIFGIPLMSYIGIPLRKCIGTGGALGSIVALPATVGYILSGLAAASELPPHSLGYVHLTAAAIIAPACLLFSPLGVQAAHRLPRRFLRRVFAVVLLIVSWRMLI